MVGLVAIGAAEARLVASDSRSASSKLWVELDLDGTTFVWKMEDAIIISPGILGSTQHRAFNETERALATLTFS